MPELRKIIIQNFRNIELQELEFSPNINCISGGNGEGKTNLMDAIWYLSMTKSAFSLSDQFNFRYGTSAFALMGHYNMTDGNSSRFGIQVNAEGEKHIRRDDKAISRASDHIGTLPIVMVSPSDISLVSESGEERRKFINSVLSQTDKSYLSCLQQYNRLLLQRNRMLKDGITDEELLKTFDLRMEAFAQPVFEKRLEFCKRIEPIVKRYYNLISNGKEDVGIEFSSELTKGSLSDILQSKRDKDCSLKYTSSGIQRDDIVFNMNGHPIKKCGSQGQQKTFLVALKFAQHELMQNIYGYPPIMLLDDLFDKLDPSRVANLLAMVSDSKFGQIFISDPDTKRTKSIIDSLTTDRAYFEARGGVFTYRNE